MPDAPRRFSFFARRTHTIVVFECRRFVDPSILFEVSTPFDRMDPRCTQLLHLGDIRLDPLLLVVARFEFRDLFDDQIAVALRRRHPILLQCLEDRFVEGGGGRRLPLPLPLPLERQDDGRETLHEHLEKGFTFRTRIVFGFEFGFEFDFVFEVSRRHIAIGVGILSLEMSLDISELEMFRSIFPQVVK